MVDERSRERDLILTPNEYCFILDETKGNVINYVGPHKTSLANTDQPVVFNSKTKKFERCILEKAVQITTIAPEGWYVVLKNPALDNKFPRSGTSNTLSDLNTGRKINVPGPVSFSLWPGQMANVVQGHHLRSNQYLIVRIYDEESARNNWTKAVIKSRSSDSIELVSESPNDNITLGKLFVIKGVDVSFYIPPTGVEVIRNDIGEYIREAVTLEKLEYCILLDEDGNKRYVRGPDVVFPEPTENFIYKEGAFKFKAIELNEISGIYIKVIADYSENGKEFKVGDELFITGKEQMIYFPRTEHAIIRYGGNEIHYAIAIPKGEGRYVLDRLTGSIDMKKGPCMFLPDPRREVVVLRVLDAKTISLWYPDNKEAIEFNSKLATTLSTLETQSAVSTYAVASFSSKGLVGKKATVEFAGDDFTRSQTYSKPRSITLDTKYDGVPSINVWTGYAIQVVGKDNSRKVVVGPSSYLLEYDETLEKLEFSTGKPKTTDRLEKSVYLRVLNNYVTDIITVETLDLCEINIKLSYRVNFEGDSNKWFDVENYVKLLCDNIRSLLKNVMKQYKVEDFYSNPINIVRDTILGLKNEEGKRSGRLFPENGMRVFDVEILSVEIGNETISDLLIQSQHNTVEQTLILIKEKKDLEIKKQRELIKREQATSEAVTTQILYNLEIERLNKKIELDTLAVDVKSSIEKRGLDNTLLQQETLSKINKEELSRQQEKQEFNDFIEQSELDRVLLKIEKETKSVVDKVNAISPDLIAALQTFGDKESLIKLSENMSPLAILGGKSIVEVISSLLKGTRLEKVLGK